MDRTPRKSVAVAKGALPAEYGLDEWFLQHIVPMAVAEARPDDPVCDISLSARYNDEGQTDGNATFLYGTVEALDEVHQLLATETDCRREGLKAVAAGQANVERLNELFLGGKVRRARGLGVPFFKFVGSEWPHRNADDFEPDWDSNNRYTHAIDAHWSLTSQTLGPDFDKPLFARIFLTIAEVPTVQVELY